MKAISIPLVLLAGVMGFTNDSDDNRLDDAEIAHIAVTAGNVDVSYAHLALAFSHHEGVREFANMMLRDHPAVNEQAGALLQRLGVTPKDNPTSQEILEGARKFRDELSGLRGEEFDRRYAQNEVEYHRFVNGALEDLLIPSVQNAEFKAALQGAHQLFQGHLAAAEQLARSMGVDIE